jgi:O-antigen/teichoic acid export membrane protein
MKKLFTILLFVFVITAVFVVPVFAQGQNPPIALPDITALTLGTIIAAALSLLLDYFPGIAAKYDALSVAAKRQWAAVFAIVIVGVVFALTCTNFVTSNLTCTVTGAWDAVSNIIYVFVVGQGVHAGTKPTPAFKTQVLKIPAAPNE